MCAAQSLIREALSKPVAQSASLALYYYLERLYGKHMSDPYLWIDHVNRLAGRQVHQDCLDGLWLGR